eukprot:TRINITY_DN58940_c0_g1_i1.p1 TRINITY_DN58940_c0_g1~~TRINITY_DN58940_c0_g1_i1.p1  ORF type:complete len:450 (-),score=112.71 TRINITY_DN58940_c0_g1_i1:235-1584(-)
MYRVVNMAFDAEMRPHFLSLAAALRTPSDGLPDAFREYLRAAAAHLESGDFEGLLQADLAQSQAHGRLYLSVFPHEGYWADNLKFPMTFALGIKDESSIIPSGAPFDGLLDSIAGRVRSVAAAAGLPANHTPQASEAAEANSIVGIWTLQTAGFKRAFLRDPGGHDYPKRAYPGATAHRSVILCDTVRTWSPLVQSVLGKVVGDDFSEGSFEGLFRFVAFHEAVHGKQMKPDDRTLAVGAGGTPLTLSEAFGAWWGVLVEPWADAGAMLIAAAAAKSGIIDSTTAHRFVLALVGYQLLRFRARGDILDAPTGSPHLTGSSVFLARLLQAGVLNCSAEQEPPCRLPAEASRLREAMEAVAGALFDDLANMAARGALDDLKELVKSSVAAIPMELEQRLLDLKTSVPSYSILDRGDLLEVDVSAEEAAEVGGAPPQPAPGPGSPPATRAEL